MWAIVGLYAILTVAFHIPSVQHRIADTAKNALEEKLGTKVEINRVDLGMLNRIIVDGLCVYDQQGTKMLSSTRLSARIDIWELIKGRVLISSAQIFGMNANIYHVHDKNEPSDDDVLNCQFVIDSLSSKQDSTPTNLDLRISSLVIRNGAIRYDDLALSNISTHIIIYNLTNQNIDAELKSLALDESRGFRLNKMSFVLDYDINDVDKNKNKTSKSIRISELKVALPHTDISVPKISVEFNESDEGIDYNSIVLNAILSSNKLSPSDFQAFADYDLKSIPNISFETNISGKRGYAQGDISASSHADRSALRLSTSAHFGKNKLDWNTHNISITATREFVSSLFSAVPISKNLNQLGNITIDGSASGNLNSVTTALRVSTSDAGNLDIDGNYGNDRIQASLNAKSFDLGAATSDKMFGTIDGLFDSNIQLSHGTPSAISLSGNLNSITVNGYDYNDIALTANYQTSNNNNANIDADITSNDKNAIAHIKSLISLTNNKISKLNGNFEVSRIVPKELNITDKWGNSSFAFNLETDVAGNAIDDITGSLNISDLTINGAHKSLLDNDESYPESSTVQRISVNSYYQDKKTRVTNINSDFCNASISGNYSFSTLPQSLINVLKRNFSSNPGRKTNEKSSNQMAFNLSMNSLDFVRVMTGADVQLNGKAQLRGYINERTDSINIYATIPHASVNSNRIDNLRFLTWTPNKALSTSLRATLTPDNGNSLNLDLDAQANDDILKTSIKWKSLAGRVFAGHLNTVANTYELDNGNSEINIGIEPSDIQFGDSIWHLHSGKISYSSKHLSINDFAFENDNQHLFINGNVSDSPNDSITVDLQNVNVEYIMDIVNFHSVDFTGFATGKVYASQLFSSSPVATTHLEVDEFTFDNGNLGTLYVDANYNTAESQIDIDAVARDSISELLIQGNVSPQRNSLDLKLTPNNTRLNFLQTYCKSFLDNIDLYGTGNLRLYGPFSRIDLIGDAVVKGEFDVKSLGCHYVMPGDQVTLVHDDILIDEQPILDRYGRKASISGSLSHRSFGQMRYNFHFDADNFLAYDFKEFGENTFYGTAFVTGDCSITGSGNNLYIDFDGSAQSGSTVVYNASSPDAVSHQEFISWHSANDNENTFYLNSPNKDDSKESNAHESTPAVNSNIYMNFDIAVTEDCTLRILMDERSGDDITFHGTGDLQAKYYNKGNFELFGNYNVNSGIYRMSIQNLVTRRFNFMQGSSIQFIGDPFSAALDLRAKYTINSVPLSDLNIGQSVTTNNVPVDCLLNIEGTAGAPRVSFDLDLRNVNSDIKQMIYSLINSEEELNQQCLFLLSVGRFYAQGSNNASSQSDASNRTNLAMQSFLSGTISQQLETMLTSMLNNNNWTLGANISPGDEGFYNAEYEGIFNGKLFSNRLLINGQVGYRDNAATASQGFIGDIDARWLLNRNGNIALRAYNQTNDRYFTKNALNTQGIGIIFKNDFSTWRELFYKKK